MTDIPPPRPPETLEETMARLQQHRPAPRPQGEPEVENVPPADGVNPFQGTPGAGGRPAGATPAGPAYANAAPTSAPPASAPPWAASAGQFLPQHDGFSAPLGDGAGSGYGPAYVPAGARTGAAPERKRSRKAPWIIAGVGAVVAIVAGSIALTVMSSNGTLDGVDWSAYPGTSYSDPAEVLADTSLENLTEKAAAVETAYRDRLTEEFGLVWTQSYEGDADAAPNGYGGDSLLHNYNSGEWQGSANITDPDARQRVYEIFLEVVEEAGMTDSYLANEIYDDDDEASKEQFGAPFGSEQAVWTMSSSGLARTFTLSTKVFDQSYPVDKTFTGDVWFRLDDASNDNFHVTYMAWAYLLLSSEDRAEYIERLTPYEGLELPEPR